MSSHCCGLDFGTSNSTIGIIKQQTCELVPLEGNRPIMRSAIFCDAEQKRWVFGQEGINLYMEGGSGRLLMALKSVLGSPLMNDETFIFNEFVSYSQILGHFVKDMKAKAEQAAGHELTNVVLGRPVHFHDTDKEQDQRAQNTLEEMARKLGFKDISFQYEPIAAAITYEATLRQEELALIVDMGGGTSDFTIIRLQPKRSPLDRTQDVLANCGVHIAGTDFDQSLSLHAVMPLLGLGSTVRGSSSDLNMPVSIYHDLTMWHLLNQLYTPVNINHVRKLQTVAYDKILVDRLVKVLELRAGHQILQSVETTKQQLSDRLSTSLDLSFIENDLAVNLQQSEFNQCIAHQVEKIVLKITETVAAACVRPEDITAIFYTGGSSKVPVIRERINAMFPAAEVVQGDAFGSVGMGLTIEAMRRG
jgi:hypothetical chaperone protein